MMASQTSLTSSPLLFVGESSTTASTEDIILSTTAPTGVWESGAASSAYKIVSDGGAPTRQEEPDVQEVIYQILSITDKNKLFEIMGRCRSVNEDIDKILRALIDTPEMKSIFIYLRNVKNKNLRIAEAANDKIVEFL